MKKEKDERTELEFIKFQMQDVIMARPRTRALPINTKLFYIYLKN